VWPFAEESNPLCASVELPPNAELSATLVEEVPIWLAIKSARTLLLGASLSMKYV
jgi:hypothetical protein